MKLSFAKPVLAFASVLSFATAAVAAPSPAPDYVWFEAESAIATNFPAPDKGGFAPANAQEAAVLSGEKWVSVEGERAETLFLEYRVAVPQTARYNFYTRKFWLYGPFRYKWDNGAWREVRKHALLDDTGIRQFLGANWVGLNEETLTGARTRCASNCWKTEARRPSMRGCFSRARSCRAAN